MSESVEAEGQRKSGKRLRRTAEEKRRIVEATLVAGASVSRVAREYGVNANQVFQWRYEYRKRTSWTGRAAEAELLSVTLAREPKAVAARMSDPPLVSASGSIHVELPGRAIVRIESGVDLSLVRAVFESLLR